MKLRVIIDEREHDIDVPAGLLAEAEEFFDKMDSDMDRGWRMGPEFIERPSQTQRCQIAADKLLGALSSNNRPLVMLMAGYILGRGSGVSAVRIDTSGDPLATELIFGPGPAGSPGPDRTPPKPALNQPDAVARAERDVTQIYRVGQAYRFATRDPATGRWVESPLMTSAEEAQQLRLEALDARFEQLLGSAD